MKNRSTSYRHVSAIEDSGDDDASRSQLYSYIKQRKVFFDRFLQSSDIFRQTTFPKISNYNSKLENNNDPNKSLVKTENTNKRKRWDAFISHASEDKDSVARPLSGFLKAKSLNIWYDEFTLKVGDSLRKSIDEGLSKSVCGIVILSKDFFSKRWPEHELNGLYAMATNTSNKIILPVWHNITKEEVLSYSPMLADIVALRTDIGIDVIGEELEKEIRNLRLV